MDPILKIKAGGQCPNKCGIPLVSVILCARLTHCSYNGYLFCHEQWEPEYDMKYCPDCKWEWIEHEDLYDMSRREAMKWLMENLPLSTSH